MIVIEIMVVITVLDELNWPQYLGYVHGTSWKINLLENYAINIRTVQGGDLKRALKFKSA